MCSVVILIKKNSGFPMYFKIKLIYVKGKPRALSLLLCINYCVLE